MTINCAVIIIDTIQIIIITSLINYIMHTSVYETVTCESYYTHTHYIILVAVRVICYVGRQKCLYVSWVLAMTAKETRRFMDFLPCRCGEPALAMGSQRAESHTISGNRSQ